MNEYDIVVVGAGPAGCSAARAAAEKGADVLIVEEHDQIGFPYHCTGSLTGTMSGHSKEDLDAIIAEMDPSVVVMIRKRMRMWSPSGRLYEFSLEEIGARIINRPVFDLELAKQAVKAGAKIMLRTTVIDLIREDGFIKGVITNSTSVPKIYGKVVIAADGNRSQLRGIPKWEGMAWTDLRVMPGLLLYVAGVKDIEPGVSEFQLGTFRRSGWGSINPCDELSCTTGAASISDFETFKAGKWVLSKKLRDCTVLRIQGVYHAFPMGRMLPKKVKNGLILTGDASGLMGNANALASGKLAGEAAAKAIEAGDVSEKGLGIYEELFKMRKLGEMRVWHDERFVNKTEEELEELWEKIAQGEIPITN